MKIDPYAYILCAAAFLGLPLVSVSAPAADEEKIPPSVLQKYDANKDGTLDATEKAAWQADKEKQRAAREAQRAEDLARYDADKDGKLEKDERAAMKADDEKARAEKKAAQAAEAEATNKRLESQLHERLAAAEQSINATRTAAMGNVGAIAAEIAAAIVERLIGTAPAEREVAAALGDVLKR